MGPADYLNVSHLPVLDGASVACPKPEPQKRTKARKRRVKRVAVRDVRTYVFARERGICRCCGRMAAESLHELTFRSLGGIVSKENSIAVCGDGTRGCHAKLQRHEITVRGKNAEKFLAFRGLSSFPDVERGSEPGSGRITCAWAKA
jgi:hypothetical protein